MKRAYSEPVDYIPKEVRKELKLGEFAEDTENTKKKDENKRDLNKEFRDYVNGKK